MILLCRVNAYFCVTPKLIYRSLAQFGCFQISGLEEVEAGQTVIEWSLSNDQEVCMFCIAPPSAKQIPSHV